MNHHPAPRPNPSPHLRRAPPDPPSRGIIMGGAVATATGVGILVLFVLLDLLLAEPVWTELALDRVGVVTEAQPLSVREGGSGSHDAGTIVTHYVRVRFEDEEGEEHEAEIQTVDADVIRKAVAKEPLSVEYHPDDPQIVRAKGGSVSVFGYFTFIPVAVVLLGIFMLFGGLRLRAQERATHPQ